jgi:hypothetical protein
MDDRQTGRRAKETKRTLFFICAFIIKKNAIGPYFQIHVTKAVSRVFKKMALNFFIP